MSVYSFSFYRIRSFQKFSKILLPLAQEVLYPNKRLKMLYLNRFRGKPAISEFDWPFTPNHKSSPHFATCVSSILQIFLQIFQSVHD